MSTQQRQPLDEIFKGTTIKKRQPLDEIFKGTKVKPIGNAKVNQLAQMGGVGQNPEVQPLNKMGSSPSSFMGGMLGAGMPGVFNSAANFIKGAANPATLQPNSPLSKNLGKDFAEGLNNFNAQGISSATKTLANTVDFLTKGSVGQALDQNNPDIVEPSWIKSSSSELAKNINQESFKRNKANESSFSSILGDLAGNVVGSLPAMGAANSLIEKAGLSSQALKNSPKLAKLAAFLTRSGINTASTTVPTQGRLPNSQEALTGLGIDSVLSGAGAIADKAGNYLYGKIAPTTIKELGNDARKGLDIGEALSKDGVSFTRDSAMNKAKQRIKNLSDKLDEGIGALDSTPGLIKSGQRGPVQANELIDNLKEEVLKSPKLKAQFGDTKAINKAIDNVVNEFNSVVGKRKTLTYAEIQALKKKLGGGLGSFFDKADNAAKAKDIANEVIRKRAQTIIEGAVPEAKQINKELAPLITATNRAAKKGPYKGFWSDLIAGSGYAGYQGATGNSKSPEDYLKNLFIGVLGKRAINSTFAKTLAGSALKNSSKAVPIIEQLVKLGLFKK